MEALLNNIPKTHIIVVGDIMLDAYLWGKVRRISPEAPVPILHIETKNHAPGGAGNVAMNLRGLGCRTDLFGVRGDDPSGKLLARLLKDAGIGGVCLKVNERPTTTKTRILGQNQQIARLDEEVTNPVDAACCETLVKKIARTLPDADAVVLSDYNKGTFKGDIGPEIISMARTHHIPVFVDPKSTNWDHFKSATCLTPNLTEFNTATQGLNILPEYIAMRARHVRESLSLESLIITKGSAGMSVFDSDHREIRIPAKAREVFDVSGAGDTVTAVLAAACGAGGSLKDSAHLANTAAGIVVGKIGTRPITMADLMSALTSGKPDKSTKVVSLEKATEISRKWHQDGLTTVFTNGCFDIFHMGHVGLLEASAEKGDRLIVGLNSDASVKRLKGNFRPVNPQIHRANLLAALNHVDLVVIFDEDTPIDLIKNLSPHVLVKGSDWAGKTVVGQKEVESRGGKVSLVPVVKGFSTTGIIDKIRAK